MNDVEDAIQEAFVVILSRHACQDAPPWNDFTAYLFGIARNVAAGMRRKETHRARKLASTRAQVPLCLACGPESELVSTSLLDVLDPLLAVWIDGQSREIQRFISLRYADSRSLRECAKQMRRSLWYVRSFELDVLASLRDWISRRPEVDGRIAISQEGQRLGR